MRTLYRNARIYAPVAADAEAFVVDGDSIVWLGSSDAGAAMGTDRTVDLGGALVTPAFVDAHVHTTATGIALTSLDLSGARSLAEALDHVERHSRATRGRAIIGGGWDETNWPEGRPPTPAELDRAAYGGSVYLARVDVHSAVISSSLRAVIPGLSSAGGVRDDQTLVGEAHHLARAAAYATLGPAGREAAQRAALRRAAELGIGSVHEMAGPEVSGMDDARSLTSLASGEPGVEVFLYWGELHGIAAAEELGAVGAGGDLFCDGSLGSHTAALTSPYDDEPLTSGALRFGTEELVSHIEACQRAGLQTGFHAIGDAAVDQVLDAFGTVSAKTGRPAGSGHRLEHAEMTTDPARLAASGLSASMQPAFDAAWGGESGMYASRLGSSRARGLNRFADLAAAGVPLAFGSDAPVTALDPWGTIRAACHPTDPSAALTPRAAFAAHTRGGWRAVGRHAEAVLAIGAPATFAVWDAGDLAVDVPDDRVARWSTDARSAVPGLPDVRPGVELPRCILTVVRGQVIYQ